MATRSRAYEEIKVYISATCSGNGRHLRAETASGRDAAAVDKLVLSLVDGEKVSDQLFPGATVWWHAHADEPPSATRGISRRSGCGSRSGRYHERYHAFVKDTYLPRIRREGRELIVKGRQRKIFTNICSVYTGSTWSHALFEHSKTFTTLAMDPARKKEIMDDLDKFKNGKEYYARVGKAWKRGYLLYGPPGTGKSSMIASMANHLDYDIYDIELTSVHSNAELRKLLIKTTPKSIILIEDIDCSLDLTGARKKKKKNERQRRLVDAGRTGHHQQQSDAVRPAQRHRRAVVVLRRREDLRVHHQPRRGAGSALIRPGRMDKHIEMGYCCTEGFKSLAKMYLDVDAHRLFDAVGELLREVEMTIANVAEYLTPKSSEDIPDSCLAALVKALEEAAAKKANGGNEHDVQDDEQ
ncbi:hypothetical protein HU200_010072 [Digitaria exilis]|uniref:AAA+ ATPase domain-containing protein n=1 Tax=Digitaria exilis TaxID=1010633 RepID=A0A835FI44_9POAL|nr:hypothetical protein HU200_010072 [Digitaria exilis]